MGLEGKIIGNRYEIIEKIGNGGMATVYRAKDMTLKRNVAVKVLKDEFTTDEEFIKRFNIEAQSAASLTHPNIVSIYDVGNEESIYYIVMELVQGKTLKQIIDEDGVLPWKWSLNIAIQIASALETAHKTILFTEILNHTILLLQKMVLPRSQILESQKPFQIQQLQLLEQLLVLFTISHQNMQEEDLQMLSQIYTH